MAAAEFKKSTFRKMQNGELPETVSFVRQKVYRILRRKPKDRILFTSGLNEGRELEKETDNLRKKNKRRFFLKKRFSIWDAGRIIIGQEQMIVTGWPFDVYSRQTRASSLTLTPRDDSVALVQKIVGQKIPVKGEIQPTKL
jgi:hypothetical protein